MYYKLLCITDKIDWGKNISKSIRIVYINICIGRV